MLRLVAFLFAALMIAGSAQAQTQSSEYSVCYGSLCPEELDEDVDEYLCTLNGYMGFEYSPSGWTPGNWSHVRRQVALRTYERWGHTSNTPSWAIYELDNLNSVDFHACERGEEFSDILDCGEYLVNTDSLRITHSDTTPYLDERTQHQVIVSVGTCEAN